MLAAGLRVLPFSKRRQGSLHRGRADRRNSLLAGDCRFHGTTFEEAEALKTNPKEQTCLFPVIRPVMEKVASIVNRHIEGYQVDKLYLVGGTCAYPGMDRVVEEMTGIETILPGNPLFVTPLGIAMHNN